MEYKCSPFDAFIDRCGGFAGLSVVGGSVAYGRVFLHTDRREEESGAAAEVTLIGWVGKLISHNSHRFRGICVPRVF